MCFFRVSIVLSCDFFSTISFSFGFSLRDFSAPAFPGYCLLSSHALLFLSLGVENWSASLAFPHFSYAVHGYPSSLFPSCSSLPFRSLDALLTRSHLRFTPRRGLPLGRVSSCLASLHSSFARLRTPIDLSLCLHPPATLPLIFQSAVPY